MKIYTEIMSLHSASFITCLTVAIVTYSQGLQFSMDTIPDKVSCGQLYCWIDEDTTDTNIFSIIGLTIYYVTPVNISVKLASLSRFGSNIDVQKTEIIVLNATGSISRQQAELTLDLGDTSYCRNVSFLCELDFTNASGEAGVITKSVSPGTSKSCHEIEKEKDEIQKELVKSETENFELEKENAEQRNEIAALKTELSKLQKLLNTTHDLVQVTCVKGMPHNSSREKFLLWDKVPALCDTETDGGGWIIIQRRTKGDVDFYRGWEDYKYGFGTPDTDFWFGNDFIHSLTSQGYTELRVDMEYQGRQYFVHYSHFDVAAETSLYRLSVSGYSGTTWNALSYQDGRNFSTFDQDNDDASDRNCASIWHGAWWYNSCTYSNLNGMWVGRDDGSINAWGYNVTFWMRASVSEMKVRHV